jgi:guanylate kinase
VIQPRLFVVSAPSGAGKTTLCRRLRQEVPDVAYSVSFTTRPPRPGEVEGMDYHFVSLDRFEAMIEAGEFLEWAHFIDHFSGTARKTVQTHLDRGRHVLADVDVVGARQIKAAYPDAVTIFVVPPSFRELIRRLNSRGTETPEQRQKRLDQARVEIRARTMFEYLVINDDLDQATMGLIHIIRAEGLCMPRDEGFWTRFFEDAP